MNEQPNPNFLDMKTIVAIIMVGVIWFGWQSYLEKKYPDTFHPPQTAASPATTPTAAPTTDAPVAPSGTSPAGDSAQIAVPGSTEQKLPFADDHWKFEISSRGMGLEDVTLKTFTDREGNPIVIGVPGRALFALAVNGASAPLNFELKQTGPESFEGRAEYQGAHIVKTIQVNSATFSLETSVKVEGGPNSFAGVNTTLMDEIHAPVAAGLFSPSMEKSETYVAYGTAEDRVNLKPGEALVKSFSDVSLVGLGSHYFVTALLDQSDVIPTVTLSVRPQDHVVSGLVSYTPIHGNPAMNLSYKSYMGPKSMTLLRLIDARMTRMINFGMFSWIARPLLELMKGIYAVVGNWGLAIIVLTLLVRMVVLPINVFSFRSMKAMQKIQPQMKSLREKYKDDPKTLNVEMMNLMKQHKVNPLGGCLPMLLQFPVFLALYAVLGQSIELYKAPFIFWIHDLSLKDPYYVLPVLMGVSMFMQQRLTPSTMDPAQAKVMMFMPIVFSFLMFGLPSGLTLYIFVSTLFGIGQQFIFMRDRPALVGIPQRA